jgi:hypothetical protein
MRPYGNLMDAAGQEGEGLRGAALRRRGGGTAQVAASVGSAGAALSGAPSAKFSTT